MMTNLDPVVEAPPYRPFRVMARVLAGGLVALAVWLPLAFLTAGFRMGPGERIKFASLAEARQNAFVDYGIDWPGSRVESNALDEGYVVRRKWLGLVEVQVPLQKDLSTDTAAYELGTGDALQQAIVLGMALVPGVLVFKGLRKPRPA